MRLLRLKNCPIWEQLRLEEALLRTNDENWCIVNEGSPEAIVVGVSGNPEELIEMERAEIPIWKRFSGGGTVVVDHNTLFVSWIMQREAVDVAPYPEPILAWTADFYKRAFGIEGFALRENDYVIGEKKCGGNAQYLRKGRWLHHTTFLCDYSEANMALLKYPARVPDYRAGRDHTEFVTKMGPMAPLVEGLVRQLGEEFDVLEGVAPEVFPEHRQSTCLVEKKSVEGV